MKLLLLIATLVAVSYARPQQNPKDVQVLAYNNDVGLTGYKFEYKLSDQTEHEESGELQNVGSDNEFMAAKGSYKYISPDGQTIEVSYSADNNGYRSSGVHLRSG